ncbi:MAG: hypothetical protein U0165_00155 [Polyangiaceae bacterium]
MGSRPRSTSSVCPRLAEGEAAIILVGRPADPDVGQALSRGLAGLIPEDARAEDLLIALGSAFSLLEARSRAESRGKWLNRYRYELGELIEIARAITTEREIDKLLGFDSRKGLLHHRR